MGWMKEEDVATASKNFLLSKFPRQIHRKAQQNSASSVEFNYYFIHSLWNYFHKDMLLWNVWFEEHSRIVSSIYSQFTYCQQDLLNSAIARHQLLSVRSALHCRERQVTVDKPYFGQFILLINLLMTELPWNRTVLFP